jgi:hypothetical protein
MMNNYELNQILFFVHLDTFLYFNNKTTFVVKEEEEFWSTEECEHLAKMKWISVLPNFVSGLSQSHARFTSTVHNLRR